MAGLTEILCHRPEIGHEILRTALLVARKIGAILFKVVAGQTTAALQHAEMRLMDEIREASQLALDRRRREIDDPAFARDVVDAVTFRARPLSVLAGEKIEDRRRAGPYRLSELGDRSGRATCR